MSQKSEGHPLGTLDALAAGASPIHRLDPRAKVLATGLYLVTVASFGRYEVAALVPFALFPAALAALAGLPAGLFLRPILATLPFVLLLGALNPWLDRAPMVNLGPVHLAAGWVSFASILLRTALMVAAGRVLAATTALDGLCLGLEQLGLPPAFTRQVALLHRYTFVLAAETARLRRARAQRAFGKRLSPAGFTSLAGQLLLRAWDRAHRVQAAMVSRGFTGCLPRRAPPRWQGRDLLFTAGWACLFGALRLWNLPDLLGRFLTGGSP